MTTARDLYPQADPTDPAVVAKQQARLAALKADLDEYWAHKGEPGYYFGRGFVGGTKAAIRRTERWLKLVAAGKLGNDE